MRDVSLVKSLELINSWGYCLLFFNAHKRSQISLFYKTSNSKKNPFKLSSNLSIILFKIIVVKCICTPLMLLNLSSTYFSLVFVLYSTKTSLARITNKLLIDSCNGLFQYHHTLLILLFDSAGNFLISSCNFPLR